MCLIYALYAKLVYGGKINVIYIRAFWRVYIPHFFLVQKNGTIRNLRHSTRYGCLPHPFNLVLYVPKVEVK